jgi:hypothetical protein
MHLPDLKTEDDGITPVMPQGAYAPDYKDDWVALVTRRLTKKMPDLSTGQRRVLASIAFTRRYERMTVKCSRCEGNGYDPTYSGSSQGSPSCQVCQGRGQVSKPTVRYVGRDARTRPVAERYEYGQWKRWAIGRSGDPQDIAEPIAEGRPY